MNKIKVVNNKIIPFVSDDVKLMIILLILIITEIIF